MIYIYRERGREYSRYQNKSFSTHKMYLVTDQTFTETFRGLKGWEIRF